MDPITAAVTFVDSETGRNYTVRLVKEDASADDASGRYVVGPVAWRDGRLPFTFSDNEGDPHGEARHVGNLFNLRRETINGETWVTADLDWDTDDLAVEAKRLVDEDRIVGVSISPSDGEAFMLCGTPPAGSTADQIKVLAGQFDPEACDMADWTEAWVGLVIASATQLMTPAFEDAQVVVADATNAVSTRPVLDSLFDSDGKPLDKTWLVELATSSDAIVAADLKRPPADWFTDPHLTEPTPLTVTDDGQVFGHLALWSTCHRGFDNTCITPPKESTEYAEFHDNARVMLDTGELIGVGCLTVDVSHADVRASAESAKRHYDHSGTTAAFTRAGQDEIGVWLAGAVAPWATDEARQKLRMLSLSGDWRPKGGSYFLIAAQAVPVPGFPIRARVASGEQVSLTTVGPANPIPDPLDEMTDLGLVATALATLAESVAFIRDRFESEDRQREYEKALAILND